MRPFDEQKQEQGLPVSLTDGAIISLKSQVVLEQTDGCVEGLWRRRGMEKGRMLVLQSLRGEFQDGGGVEVIDPSSFIGWAS